MDFLLVIIVRFPLGAIVQALRANIDWKSPFLKGVGQFDPKFQVEGDRCGTNRKPICDFLLVINTNLHPISQRFKVIADYWSNLRLGVHVFNTLIRDEPLNSGPQSLALKKLASSLYRMVLIY